MTEKNNPARAWLVLEALGFPHELPNSASKVTAALPNLPDSTDTGDIKEGEQKAQVSTVKARVFLGPDGRPMINNLDLRQPVLIRSERFLDYLYYLYEVRLGRSDIPSASALKAVQRVLAGLALKAGSLAEEGVSTDPLLDILLTVLEKQFKEFSRTKFTLPALANFLRAASDKVGYDPTDLPAGTAELSKQIKDRAEALAIRKIEVGFSRKNSARFVEFTNLLSEFAPDLVKENIVNSADSNSTSPKPKVRKEGRDPIDDADLPDDPDVEEELAA